MLFKKLHELATRNGRMQLVKFFGTERLLAQDHTEQSGPYMNGVWKTAFNALSRSSTPKTLTFFGVGAGGALRIAAKRFPQTKIIGIEWDPLLHALATEHLSPYENITLVEADAEAWIANMQHTDISCIDLFTGSDVAPCVRNLTFIQKIITNSHITFINVYTHTDILDAVDKVVAPIPHKRLQYYATTLGMYGSPHFRS